MAMYKEVTQIFGVAQDIAAKRQNLRNVLRLRGLRPRRFLDDIVELQLKPGMPVTADVEVGQRNFLAYLFARILPIGLEGMREP